MEIGQMVRHGDVQVARIEKPGDLKDLKKVERDNGRVILAYGEVTGHAHAISEENVFAWQQDIGQGETALYIEVRGDQPVALKHEEHKTINLAPGWYRSTIKRQFNEKHGWTNVVD